MKARVALFCISVLCFLQTAFSQKTGEAVTQENFALACRLADQADALRKENPSMLETSVLLSIEAIKLADTVETNGALRASADLLAQPELVQPCSDIKTIAVSHDGRYIAVGQINGTLRLFFLEPEETDSSGVKKRQVTEATPIELDSTVNAVDFSSDSAYLAAGTEAGTLEIINLKKYSRIPAPPHRKAVNAVLFKPKSHIFATASDDKTANLVDAENARILGSPIQHEGAVHSLAFNDSGDTLATGGTDRIIKLTSTRTLKLVGFSMKQAFIISAVCFLEMGTKLAAAEGNNVVLFPTNSDKPLDPLKPIGDLYGSPNGKIQAMACNGHWLVTGGTDRMARLFDVTTQQEAFSPLIHTDTVSSVAISPDGRWIATGSADKCARLFELDNGKEVARLPHSSNVARVAFAAAPENANYLATVSDRQFKIYPVENRQELLNQSFTGHAVAAALSSDAKLLAVGDEEHTLYVLPVPGTSDLWHNATTHIRFVNTVAFSPDNRWLASGDNGGTRVFDISHGDHPVNQFSQSSTVNAIAFSPDNEWVATASAGSEPFVWIFKRMDRNISYRVRYEGPVTVTALAFSPDGSILGAGVANNSGGADNSEGATDYRGPDDYLQLFKVTHDKGPKLEPLAMPAMLHGNAVRALQFSSDGRLATGSDDKMARIFPAFSPQGAMVASSPLSIPHPGKVAAIAFSSNGALLATATDNGTMRIYETASGKQLIQINDQFTVVKVLKFAENDQSLFTVSIWKDRTSVHRHLLSPNGLIKQACAHLSRNLSNAEWKAYGGIGTSPVSCSNLPVP